MEKKNSFSLRMCYRFWGGRLDNQDFCLDKEKRDQNHFSWVRGGGEGGCCWVI